MYMKNQSAPYHMRILQSWTRDEWGAIRKPNRLRLRHLSISINAISSDALTRAGKPPVARYNKDYLKGEFRRLFSLPAAFDNKVSREIDKVLDYYTALYKLNSATMNESQWYSLYSRVSPLHRYSD